MITFACVTEENIKDLNPIFWPHISGHPYRVLIIGSSESGETNALLILINHKPYTDQLYLNAKDPYERKKHLLINNKY